MIELFRTLIQNACVNDGSPESGFEARSVGTLVEFFGVEGEIFEPAQGRQSLVYRVQGFDPLSPSLVLAPHLDVVPADADRWSVDPFSAEIIDGFVYGRGAVDMLNVVASMAVAFKPYLTGELKPKGDLVFCALADEEGGGRFGAHKLVRDHWALVGADYLLTEVAYPGLPGGDAPVVPVSVGEKGSYFSKLKVTGTPGHGSAPYASDNAVETIVAALHQIITTPSPAAISEQWIDFAVNLGLDRSLSADLIDIDSIDSAIDRVAESDPRLARYIHAATHLTVSPNFVRAGSKANVIADRATTVLDIRSLPGMDRDFVDAYLREAMGEIANSVEIVPVSNDEAGSGSTDNPLWTAIADAVEDVDGHRNIIPMLATVATDARFWRRQGTVAFGVGLYDEATPFSEFMALFHGTDERVSINSVLRTTALFERILSRFSTTHKS